MHPSHQRRLGTDYVRYSIGLSVRSRMLLRTTIPMFMAEMRRMAYEDEDRRAVGDC